MLQLQVSPLCKLLVCKHYRTAQLIHGTYICVQCFSLLRCFVKLVTELETLGDFAALRVLVLEAVTFGALLGFDESSFEYFHVLSLPRKLSLSLEQIVDLPELLDHARCLVIDGDIVDLDHDLLLGDYTWLVELLPIGVALPLSLRIGLYRAFLLFLLLLSHFRVSSIFVIISIVWLVDSGQRWGLDLGCNALPHATFFPCGFLHIASVLILDRLLGMTSHSCDLRGHLHLSLDSMQLEGGLC